MEGFVSFLEALNAISSRRADMKFPIFLQCPYKILDRSQKNDNKKRSEQKICSLKYMQRTTTHALNKKPLSFLEEASGKSAPLFAHCSFLFLKPNALGYVLGCVFDDLTFSIAQF
jgi:hypothetical protein